MTTRPIYVIAQEIRADWQKPYFGALPYLKAMECIETVNDMYIAERAKHIVISFLANASTWRGETARRIKKELNDMVK